MREKMENPPSMSALKEAVKVMATESKAISDAVDMLAVRIRMHCMKVELVLEALDVHIGDRPPCPVGVFPELNHCDES